MSEDLKTLSWHDYELFTLCPQRFTWHKAKKPASLGDGLRFHALWGLLFQKIWEKWINEERFKTPDAGGRWMHDSLEPLLEALEKEEKSEISFLYSYKYPRLLLKTEVKALLDPVRNDWLKRGWPVKSQSEVTIQAKISEKYAIRCRADFLIDIDGLGLVIVDGKGTKNPSGTNKDQVKFAALIQKINGNKLPVSLGYYYWRLIDTKWIKPWGVQQLLDYEQEVRANIARIESGESKPTPKDAACKYCTYRFQCDAYQVWQKSKGLDIHEIGGDSVALL